MRMRLHIICIPFILCGSPNKCGLYMCHLCKSDLVIRIAGFAIIIGVYWYCFSQFSLCEGIIKSKPVTGYECRIDQTI